MSTRAIAPIVGVSQSSVDRDLEVTRNGSPAPEPPEYVDTTTGEVLDHGNAPSLPGNLAPITGLDALRPGVL